MDILWWIRKLRSPSIPWHPLRIRLKISGYAVLITVLPVLGHTAQGSNSTGVSQRTYERTVVRSTTLYHSSTKYSNSTGALSLVVAYVVLQ